jgi:deoxyribonuclease IV
MLVGAHVSPAGGPANAVGRGVERHSTAIQFFNQSPRAWRSRVYTDEEAAAFRSAVDESPIEATLIHAVYLINCASSDSSLRKKSLTALTNALVSGDAIGAHAVVLHAGSALAGQVGAAIKRAGKVIREALESSESCPLHLENTAGAGGTLGRSFEELAALLEAAGGGKRLGICLDSCHLYASGYDIRTAKGLAGVVDEYDAVVGLDRLGSLHLNDSQVGLGTNRDRHAVVGEGELGPNACATFLSEPRFEELPCVLETGSRKPRSAPAVDDIDLAWKLRKQGLRRRARSN